jgi:hypothetical protein
LNFESGKAAGTTFEKVFERACQLSGLWAEPNHIKARRGWKGRLQELKSNLDFTVIDRSGRVAFIDAKTFQGDFFTYSDIPEHQRQLAARYNAHQVSAGFVVWFRRQNAVIFVSGALLEALGPGSRLTPGHGVNLGSWGNFDIGKVFRCPTGSPGAILRSDVSAEGCQKPVP